MVVFLVWGLISTLMNNFKKGLPSLIFVGIAGLAFLWAFINSGTDTAGFENVVKKEGLDNAQAMVSSSNFWVNGLFFVLIALIIVLSSVLLGGQTPWKAIFLSAMGSLVFVLPVLWIYLSNWHLIPGALESEFPAAEAMIDSIEPNWLIVHSHGKTAGATQSILVIAIIAAGFRFVQRKDLWIFVGSAIAFVVFWGLAMGTKLPLYELFYGWNEQLRRFWWPSRHLLMTNIAAASLLSLALVALQKQKKFQREIHWSIGIAIAIPVSIYLQGDRPFHANHSPVDLPPELYQQLEKRSEKGIIQPPLNPKISRSQTALLFQIYHRKKMLNGHAQWVDRVRPTAWDAFIEEHSLLGYLSSFEEAEFSGTIEITMDDIQELLDIELELFVIDRELLYAELPQILTGYLSICRQLFGREILSKEARHMNLGYATTSHASQGKDAKTVFIVLSNHVTGVDDFLYVSTGLPFSWEKRTFRA